MFFFEGIEYIVLVQEDLELIERLQRQDHAALSALYDKYAGALYGVIFRMCKNGYLAEDLLQETFVKIWRKADQYDPSKGKFFTWAYRVAKNTTLNALRKTAGLIQNEDLSVYEGIGIEEAHEDFLALKGSLAKLAKHHQEAIELVYFKGLTHKEAHEEMGVPLGTFKSYVRQALTKLREMYQLTLLRWWIMIEMLG